MIHIGHRFMTAQTCNTTGEYDFDGYTDGSMLPAPTTEEKRIPVNAGKVFPTVPSCNKAAFWKFAG